MAVGVPFPQANVVLRAPTPEDAAAETVYDLHVHLWRDLDGQPHVISKWKLTPDELHQVVCSGGELWFHCWGSTHPPISIQATDPFERPRPADG